MKWSKIVMFGHCAMYTRDLFIMVAGTFYTGGGKRFSAVKWVINGQKQRGPGERGMYQTNFKPPPPTAETFWCFCNLHIAHISSCQVILILIFHCPKSIFLLKRKVALFYSCPPPPVFWNWNFCRSDQLIQVDTSLNHLLQPAGQFSTRSMIVSDKRHKTQPLMIVAVEFALFSQHLAKLEDSCCTGKMGPPKVEIIWWFECLWFQLTW